MREPDFGVIARRSDLEDDFGAGPFVGVFGEVQPGVHDLPDHLAAGYQLADPLLRVVDVLVAVGEHRTLGVGRTFDLAGPPAADVRDGGEGLFGCLVHHERGGEIWLVMA